MNSEQNISNAQSRLRGFYHDSGEQLWSMLSRLIADPLRPKTTGGSIRLNPVLLLLLVVVVVTQCTFVVFNSLQR